MATSSASEMKVQIEPLDGSNYLSWKFNVKLVLMQSGLWGIVSGAEKAPVASEDDKKEKEIVDFRVRSEKAYSQIALNVKKELQVHVANTVDPKEAWGSELHTMYQIIAGMVSRVGSITAIYAKSAVNALRLVFGTL